MAAAVAGDDADEKKPPSLEAAIPDASITLESWSQDRSEFTLAAWRMDQPVEYYFYDSNDG